MPRLACLTAQIRAAYLAASGATLLSVLLLPLSADAAPVDPVVRAGTATFAINGNVYTVTNAPNTIIDWRQFNTANGELLRFIQQNPQSVVLNRVTGNDPSQLFGLLQSNGKVVLVNPNGILFGPNAQVDVAGLIASTLNLSDADFLAGRMAFNGGGGLLNNQGRITTPLGGSVFLLGGDVTNSGVITAPGGRILLAAGQSISLADAGTPGLSVTLKANGNKALNLGEVNAQGGSIDMYGALVDHQGIARADSAAVDARGNIVLKATDAATVTGAISAAGTAGQGGSVQVLGDSVALGGSARIDASGAQGGGTVLVGGDFKGANPAVANARTATVAAGAQIDASATGNGDGGKVVVWSNDKTDFAGSIFARGGAQGGNGGQVETSGKVLSFDKGYVNTLAPKGLTGNWLLDPAVFCFYASSSSECTGAAAAGATSFNQLGNILVSTGGTLQATDFITFLPSGGNAAVAPTIPSGVTMTVKAPYIEVGNGSTINTRAVGLVLDASSAYGTTTLADTSGANLTGTIAIGGDLTSNASQTLLSTGNILLANRGGAFAALRMTSATGTQSLSTTGQLLLAGGSSSSRQAALFSDGAQTINAGQLTLRAGNAAGTSGGQVEINAKGSQTITATDVTLQAGEAGWAIISNNATGAKQTIKADSITVSGGAAGTDSRAVIINSGDNSVQDITATSALNINGGAGGVRNFGIIKSQGGATDSATTQTITAGAIKITGGGGGGGNYATIDSTGAQSVTAKSIALTGGDSGTATTGSAPYASIDSNAGGQTINVAGNLALTAGAGTLGSEAYIYSASNQTINLTAGSLVLQAGAAGKGNAAYIGMDGANVTQRITAPSITMLSGGGTDNFTAFHTNGTGITQTVTANNLSMTGGGGNTSGNWSHLWLNDTSGANVSKQTINAGTITLTGGAGGTDQNAMIGGNGEQRVNADSIALTGGAGVNAGGTIGTDGNQVIVVKNALTMKAGSNNGAEARIGGSGTSSVTADSISLQGGSAGSGTSASINASKDVTVTVNGALNLTGGAGTNNGANVSSSASLTINAGSIAMAGGATGSGNSANLNSGAAMNVTVANAFNLTAGAGGTGNSATIGSAGNETIAAATIAITGGSGGTSNHANVSMTGGTDTVQKVTAGTITMQGGQGGSDNIAGLHANGTRVTQDINATTGLTVAAGNGTGNWAHVAAGYQDLTPSTQRITTGALKLAGSSDTAANSATNALILNYGAQAIKGGSMTLAAGQTAAYVQNGNTSGGTGAQSVELTGALQVTGGAGNNAFAGLITNRSQTIAADSITLVGGGTGTNTSAYISGGNTADQAISANRIALTGGGGLRSSAGIYKGAGGGTQSITIKGGGSLTLQGGTGDTLPATGQQSDYCNGCKLSSNSAMIYSQGSSQVVDFVSGGTLTLTGGTRGSDNTALLIGNMDNGATQTITSSGGAANYPVISMTGGSGGYYNAADGANAGNVAAIGAFDASTSAQAANGLKTINAKSITLNGGGGASERGGALLATGNGNSIVNVTSDLVMNGGTSNKAFVAPTDPAKAYWPDFGSMAGITARGNVDLKVGGNLVIHGGSGISSPAGIALTNGGKLTANIAGATRIDAGASQAGITTGVTGADALPAAGSAGVTIGTADSVTTSTFASSSKSFTLEGTINVTGSTQDAQLVGSYSGGTINGPGWRALGAKPLVAEIYASDAVEVGDNAGINTPNGSWIAVLGPKAAAQVGSSENTLTYSALASHGYQWTTAAYDSSNAQNFRFILPDNSPIVETHADEVIAQTACTSNPALCVTPPVAAATPTSAVAPVVIDVKLTGGVDETPLSASLAQAKTETPAAQAAPAAAPKVQGPRVAAREKEEAKAAEDRKSTADLKREAKEATAVVKASQEAARKAALAAQKEAAEAKRLAAAAAKTEAQATRATAAVGAAEGDLRAAEADAREARAALSAATTPALKTQAQLRLATAEAARAGAEAKLADARAKRAELGAQGSEAGARRTQAESAVYDAGAKEAAAEAKLASAAHTEALLRAREAKDPAARAVAQRLADDKRIEATQRTAESDVRKSIADDLHFASEQSKAQADARQAQAQAALAMAAARRDEMRVQRALARARQEEALGGKGAAGRSAQGGKDAAEKLVAAETKRAETSQAAANAKAQAAEAKQRKADEGMAEVARRDAARRDRAVKAFVAGANASMTASQLAQLAALRHEYKGLLFKDALKVLEQNGRAADLPACGGTVSNTCMPSFAQARMEWPTSRPLVRKPVAAYLPQIERKVAIVIGINEYADKRIPQLDTAVPDADAVARQLETSMGYETRVLRNATKADIVAALQGVARELDPNDSLVVYYAGHGYLRPVAKGQSQGYWIPSDGTVSSPANWMSNADVSKLLANIPAKQVMLVSDSCYSGTFSREQKVAASGDASSILAKRSVTVMSSGGEEPVSDEGVEGHSIFAWSLMQSIKKVGQVEPGVRVFDATREQVTAAYPQVPQYGAAVSAGHTAGGDYLFETRSYK
ncbi:hypothetical protein GCM10027277_42330 [Pseudoduganella ginsengisoli]|uniref:Filamentous hemagglutinin N-terminal domain-containing protein n=1 Tax=Pseudoduganella ginsengisoli TaxID=1462440 RepID=A0A6L6Q9A8_9BURK|nr:caspase family protein [Pseudoduganella ginsengisoli]MTW05802.1 filamentous hemagglutinin N-terminal domain-containing protein [Pseudoduganella ginsengisoli]